MSTTAHAQAAVPYWRLSGFYFFYFSLLGGLAPYWGLYLQHLGFEAQAIGALMAILMATKIIAPNLWGYLADRSGQRLRIVRFGVWMTLLCFSGVFVSHDFEALALVMLGFSFFWNAVLPQFEAVTLSHLRDQANRYSHIRLWGSIGFIVSVMLLGWLLDRFGPALLPGSLWAMMVLLAVASLMLRERGDNGRVRTASGSFLAAVKQPHVLAFFIVCLLMQLSHGPYYTFYSIYMESHAYSRMAIGWLWSLGVVAEVGVFIFMHRWLERYGTRAILLLSLGLAALRWWLIGAYPEDLPLMLFAQCLHGATFGSFHAVAIELVRRFFPGPHAGQGQALYSSASFGIGGALGAYFSGVSWQLLGAAYTYWIAAGAALLALAIGWRWVHGGYKPSVQRSA